MTAADAPVELHVEGVAEPGWVDDVHDALARLWASAGHVPDLDRLRFETAVVELATNVVRHAVPVPGRPLLASARLRVDGRLLEAEVGDTGAAASVDLDPPEVDVFAESGRGIALVRRAVDTLVFERSGDRNLFRITRDCGA